MLYWCKRSNRIHTYTVSYTDIISKKITYNQQFSPSTSYLNLTEPHVFIDSLYESNYLFTSYTPTPSDFGRYLSISVYDTSLIPPITGRFLFLHLLLLMQTPWITIISGVVETVFEGNIIIFNKSNELQKVPVPMEHMMNWIKIWVHIIVEMTQSWPKSVVVYRPAIETSISHNVIRDTLALVYSANHKVS